MKMPGIDNKVKAQVKKLGQKDYQDNASNSKGQYIIKSIYFRDADLIDRLDQKAKELRLNRSDLISRILNKHVDSFKV